MQFTWDWMAAHAPIGTASVAGLALVVAIASILVQRSLARKKQAIDFFLKTEMDEKMVQAWSNYTKAIAKWREIQVPVKVWIQSYPTEYEHLRGYLNIHELLAAGVRKKILDEDICFEFWSNVLTRACYDLRDLINHIREAPGQEWTYHSLTWLNREWLRRLHYANQAWPRPVKP
jgi:hypothetical protein